ncbi:hypothetical protein [Nesterenkonia pannonica]|uniref:hypothetical protein n=1 Tax=Nesterenkonia pannonica TaxID=1548602 RepID=UPI0021648478|nr:hypothetical protein [Nesterenkonia pannonica]
MEMVTITELRKKWKKSFSMTLTKFCRVGSAVGISWLLAARSCRDRNAVMTMK